MVKNLELQGNYGLVCERVIITVSTPYVFNFILLLGLKTTKRYHNTHCVLKITHEQRFLNWDQRRGTLGFSVLRFWRFFRSVFVPQNFRVFFGVRCGSRISVFQHLVFVESTNVFSDLVSDVIFRFFLLGFWFVSSIWATITRLDWARIAVS